MRSANKDPDFRNRTKVGDEEFDRLVRNVYKVLLTRSMCGVAIYSPDAETRAALRQLTTRHTAAMAKGPAAEAAGPS